jgi:hypothetical protein
MASTRSLNPTEPGSARHNGCLRQPLLPSFTQSQPTQSARPVDGLPGGWGLAPSIPTRISPKAVCVFQQHSTGQTPNVRRQIPSPAAVGVSHVPRYHSAPANPLTSGHRPRFSAFTPCCDKRGTPGRLRHVRTDHDADRRSTGRGRSSLVGC